ncbi:major facilitator superfamily domain-containing protein [Parasitella parasitica]|nr:major facilitator superfamily domain-containing protein [Parasitella parasitica]
MPVERKPFVFTVPLVVKVDIQLLPIICLFYLLSSLDRSSIEFGNISGLKADLNIEKAEAQWAIAIYYFCVIIFDIPSNIVLRRWRPSFWLGFLMGAWGIIFVSIAACTDFNRLVIARLLSSVFEAGFFPGAIYYLSFWYTRREFGKRMGIFWACRCLAGGIGGLFAYGVSYIGNNHMHVWQWTFIIQGAPCVALALIASWYLPDNPSCASFLVTQESRIIERKLREDYLTLNYDDWSWDQVGSVFLDLKIYAYIILYLLGAACLRGVSLFLPIVIMDLNSKPTSLQSQLLLLPPYFLAIIATLALCYSSDRLYNRSYHIVAADTVSIASITVLLVLPNNIGSFHLGHYIATCILVAAVYAHIAIVITWMVNNFIGFTRRTIAIGATVSIGSVGSAAGSQLFLDPSSYSSGKSIIIALLVIQILFALFLRQCLSKETSRRSRLNTDDRQYQIYKFGGIDLVHDRHPDFEYTV